MDAVVGRDYGPYKILEPLGSGGMAAVYRGYHAAMDRYVAVKVLPPAYALDAKFVERFRREARTIAKLEHPHILPVHDFGEAQGSLYIVMRLIDTGTLDDRLQAGSPPAAEVVKIITQLADALDYAHSLGVIHRDIKPSNVLIDRRGDCFLSDFGLAKLLQETSLTTSGGLMGTPQYISPEQALGRPVDRRVDLYALGVILYQMVAGRLPFEAETPMGLALKHAQEPPLPPRTANADITPALEAVILKALEKDPANRYQSGQEMSRAVHDSFAASRAPIPSPTAAPTVAASPPVPPLPATLAEPAPPAATQTPTPAPSAAPRPAPDMGIAAPVTSPTSSGTATLAPRPRQSSRPSVSFIAVIVVIVVFAGSLLAAAGLGLNWLRARTTEIGSRGDVLPGEPLLEDFSSAALGWELIQAPESAVARYDDANGEYIVSTAAEGQLIVAASQMSPVSDAVITLETYIGQGADFKYGVMCRRQPDTFSGYAFLVRHFDLVRVARWDDGSEISPDEFTASAVAAEAGQYIEFNVACVGSDFTLSINGQQVYQGSDSTYATGDVALLVESLSDQATEIHFDKLIVSAP